MPLLEGGASGLGRVAQAACSSLVASQQASRFLLYEAGHQAHPQHVHLGLLRDRLHGKVDGGVLVPTGSEAGIRVEWFSLS